VFTVTDIADGKAVLDGNHPGPAKLRLNARSRRAPCHREELEHGTHGPGDHHQRLISAQRFRSS
jgi:FKBP-type peptidyl-prolyl cis-trans isomerase SlyD